jgi:predicted phage gp36 major capsid-like protein
VSRQNGTSNGKPNVQALRDEIARTRAELGETVQALAAKADVKARAKEQVEQTKQKVKAQAAEATEKVRDAALAASERVRHAAGRAEAGARSAAAEAGDEVQGATEQVRRNPIPVAAVLAGVVAVIGVILIVRGRRR